MKNIKRRIEAIERKLNIRNEIKNHIIKVCFVEPDGKGRQIKHYPTEPIEQNPQYIEQMKKPPVNGHRAIVLYPEEERKARERLQEETESRL